MTDGGLGIFNTNICSGPVKNMRGRHKNMTDSSYLSFFLGPSPLKIWRFVIKIRRIRHIFPFFGAESGFLLVCRCQTMTHSGIFNTEALFFPCPWRVVLHSFSLPFALSPSVALIFFFRARQPTPALLGLGSLVLGIECWVLALGSWVFAWSCVFDLWSWVLGVLSCHFA